MDLFFFDLLVQVGVEPERLHLFEDLCLEDLLCFEHELEASDFFGGFFELEHGDGNGIFGDDLLHNGFAAFFCEDVLVEGSLCGAGGRHDCGDGCWRIVFL